MCIAETARTVAGMRIQGSLTLLVLSAIAVGAALPGTAAAGTHCRRAHGKVVSCQAGVAHGSKAARRPSRRAGVRARSASVGGTVSPAFIDFGPVAVDGYSDV